MAPMPVCKYYLKGECRYGDRCKFEHPRNLPRNDNRFAAFEPPKNSSRDSYSRVNNDGRSTASQTPPFSLNRDFIVADLSTERPQWILSAYGPGSKAPAQLFGGPLREQSFEEMRLHHYNGVASGSPELAIKEANALVQEADSQMRNALSNIDAAMEFIYRAENEHPNRIDVCQASTKAPDSSGPASNNLFSTSTQIPPQPASGFGQPSTLGLKPNPFANQQAFGQPSMAGSTGTFGQPSMLGQRLNPFGSVPAGTGSTPEYGSTAGPFSSFAAKSNPFGTPAQSTMANPFRQNEVSNETQFAQTRLDENPFGQPLTEAQPSTFGSNVTSLPFSIPTSAAQQNSFGSTTKSIQDNSIRPGMHEAPPANPFGQPNPAPASSNLFAQPILKPSSNLFTQKSSSLAGLQPNPFGNPNQIVQAQVNGTAVQDPYGPNAQFQHPPLQSYVSRDGSQRLRMFKGNPVVYRDNDPGVQKRDGTWEKIWFPDGPPAYYSATELDGNAYTEKIKQAYLHVRETGTFKDGIMPLKPPRREWCLWDF